MRIVFRVDASQHIGSGHVMRCLVLAQELRESEHDVSFVTRPQTADLLDYIVSKGFQVDELTLPRVWKTPQNTFDYAAWLQVSEEEDGIDFIQKCQRADLVVVDHYGIGKKWHQKVKSALKCKLLIIDDLVREHYGDIVLDQTLNRKPAEYSKFSNCIALTGTKYALLKPSFSKVRNTQQKTLPTNHKLLISMGGIDQPNASLQVLAALKASKYRLQTTVLLSKRAPHYKSVREFADTNNDWVEHIEFIDDMAVFMEQFTLAIGAPGSTSWERACLGIPSVIIPIAQNQTTIASELAKAQAVEIVDITHIEQGLIISLENIIKNWQTFRDNNYALCDGKGCKRVLKKIESVFH